MGAIRRFAVALFATVAVRVAMAADDAPQPSIVPGTVGSTPAATRPKTEESLETAIAHALADDPRINPMQIKVALRDGIVTLTGSTKDTKEKEAAEAIVRNVQGVRDVTNRLVIAEPGAPEPGTSMIPEVPVPPAR